MINCQSADVEVLPNFFSITFIDLSDYLKTFADCKINDKVVPLVQKLTVKEIKERLDKVNCKQFYITDTDDSQLFPMIEYINGMRIINEKFTRTDVFTYNGKNYDNLMIAALLMNFNQCDNTKELITRLYNISKRLLNFKIIKKLVKMILLLEH